MFQPPASPSSSPIVTRCFFFFFWGGGSAHSSHTIKAATHPLLFKRIRIAHAGISRYFDAGEDRSTAQTSCSIPGRHMINLRL